MVTWALIGFDTGLNAIQNAYRSSFKAFDEELMRLEERYERDKDNYDPLPEDGYGYDFGEHIGELIIELQQCKKYLNESFILTSYHFWEKEIARLMNMEKGFEFKKAISLASEKFGFSMDVLSLNLCREMVNCLKHDSGKELYDAKKDWFDNELVQYIDKNQKYGWHAAFVAKEEQVEFCFKSIKSTRFIFNAE